MENSKTELNSSNQESAALNNIIFIGEKPLPSYIKSLLILFKKNNLQEVTIKSRGKFISKAVDVVEIARRQFLDSEGIKLKDIKISTELLNRDGKSSSVSAMSIILGK